VRISVVVATFNRRASLKNLLESLFRQDIEPARMEIIVVIDGSTDGTQDMLGELRSPCSMRVLAQGNAGQAAARNAGWQLASAAVVLFLDDDLECPPNLLSVHLAAHGVSDDCVVVGRIDSSADGRPTLAHDLLRRQLLAWEQRLAQSPELRWPEDAYVSTNCSVSRRLLEVVGGFDPSFYRALEDHDLGLRLWAQSGRFVYEPKAVVQQKYSKASVDAVRDEIWYGRCEVLLGQKYPSSLQHTLLARLAAMGWWRQRLLRLFAAFPASARLVLGVPISLIERIPAPESAMALGRRMLAFWMQATRLRAAVQAMGGWTAFDATFSRRLAVLMYHHVGSARTGTYPDLTVSAETFERQISALARRGYTGISPTDYLSWRLGKSALPSRAVMVTFDDGYADIAQYAFPVLASFGFGSCVFIVTGEIGGTNSWDEARGSATHRLLTREQIGEWQGKVVEFGGHSRTHVSLPSTALRELNEEIAGCRVDMQHLTGLCPVAFAYPYGDFDSRVVAEVRTAFSLAFTAEEGLNYLSTDPHLLRRTMVLPRDSGRVVVLRALLGYSPRDVLLRWRSVATRPVKRLISHLRGAWLDAA